MNPRPARDLPRRGGTIAVATSGTLHSSRADRPLIDALTRDGRTVVSAHWDDPQVDWSSFAACVVRSTWDWHLTPDRFTAWIRQAASVTRMFNDAPTLLWGLDKRYLLALAAAGVPVVPTVLVEFHARPSIPAIAAERGWERFVVKPTHGASAYRTQLIDPARHDVDAWSSANADLAGDVLIQPMVDSVQTLGEVSVVLVAGNPTHAIRKVPAAGDFRVQVEHGGQEQLEPITPDQHRAATLCLAAIPHKPTYARIDMMTAPSGALWISECEVVEPELFLDRCPSAAETLAAEILRQLD